MGWSQLVAQNVLNQFSLQEQQALQGQNNSGFQTIPAISTFLQTVINSVRGYVKAGGNMVGSPGTTPDQLEMEVLSITAWRWLSSAPSLAKYKSEDRRKLYDNGMDRLDKVAQGIIRIELPNDPLVQANQSAAPVNQVQTVTYKRRKTVCYDPVTGRAHDRMDGLI